METMKTRRVQSTVVTRRSPSTQPNRPALTVVDHDNENGSPQLTRTRSDERRWSAGGPPPVDPIDLTQLAAENEELKRRIAALEQLLQPQDDEGIVDFPETFSHDIDSMSESSQTYSDQANSRSRVLPTTPPHKNKPQPQIPKSPTERPVSIGGVLGQKSPSKFPGSKTQATFVRTGSFGSRRKSEDAGMALRHGAGAATTTTAAAGGTAAQAPTVRSPRKTPSLTLNKVTNLLKPKLLNRAASSTQNKTQAQSPARPVISKSPTPTTPKLRVDLIDRSPHNLHHHPLVSPRAVVPTSTTPRSTSGPIRSSPKPSPVKPRQTPALSTPTTKKTLTAPNAFIKSNSDLGNGVDDDQDQYDPVQAAAASKKASTPHLRLRISSSAVRTKSPDEPRATTPRQTTKPIVTTKPAASPVPKTVRPANSQDRVFRRASDTQPTKAQAAAKDDAKKKPIANLPNGVIRVRRIKESTTSRQPSLNGPSQDELKAILHLDQVAHRDRVENLNRWKENQKSDQGSDRPTTPTTAPNATTLHSTHAGSPTNTPTRPLPHIDEYNTPKMRGSQGIHRDLEPDGDLGYSDPTTNSLHSSFDRFGSHTDSSSQQSSNIDVDALQNKRAVVSVSKGHTSKQANIQNNHNNDLSDEPADIGLAVLHRAKKLTEVPKQIPTRLAPLSLADLEDLGMLGRGCFGKVKLVRHRGNNQEYALKILNKRHQIEQQQVQHAINENHILHLMDHPFIVRHYGSFQDEENLYILMERVVGTEFYDLLQEVHRFDEAQTQFFAAQIVLILDHLHSKHHVVYRDLKPENILLDSEGYLKLTDFGFAKVEPNKTYTFCGTPCYIAPEIIYQAGYTRAVDWWSLGVMIFEMLMGEPPLDNDNLLQLYDDILNTNPEFDPTIFSPEAQDLITRLLCKTPEHRLGITGDGPRDVMRHPFFYGVDWEVLRTRSIISPFGGIEYLQSGLNPYFDDGDDGPHGDRLTREEQQLFKDF